MSKTVVFDFREIDSLEAFYQQFQQQFSLPKWFGHNLDGLWDMITGEIELPVTLIFSHLRAAQRTQFSAVIELMNEAEEELDEAFLFLIDITNNENEASQTPC